MALIKSKQIASVEANIITQSTALNFVSNSEKASWNAKYDAQLVSDTTEGLMSKEEHVKLTGIEENSNFYEHPLSHSADMIDTTTSKQFASNLEKDKWNNTYSKDEVDNKLSTMATGIEWKESVSTFTDIAIVYDVNDPPQEGYVVSVDDESGQTYRFDGTVWVEFLSLGYSIATGGTDGTDGTDGLISMAAIYKLDHIAPEANKYEHPEFHLPSEITQDASNRFVTDNEKIVWNAKAETDVVTTTTDGLMSSADKVKLDSGVVSLEQVKIIPSVAQTVFTLDTVTNVNGDGPMYINEAKGQLVINGMSQRPLEDFTIAFDGSNQIIITFNPGTAGFEISSDDHIFFVFNRLL